jgi:serine/threonine protein kinase
MPLLILSVPASDMLMHHWSFTLHGPSGILSALESGETEFVLGAEQAADVWTIAGEGVAPRHALVRVAAGQIEVEDLAGGTLVNGHPITGRVEAEYPASVQVGEVTLVVEQKGGDPSEAATIVQSPRQGGVGFHELEATVVTPRVATPVIGQKTVELNEAETLCKYTLVREIARGGMGQIYFGEDPQLKRQVAVKVSSVSYGGEDPRFSKEAEVLALLAHPNIVPIYNVGVDAQSRPFYSMKLVKGRTLQAVLNALKDGDAAATKEYTQAALLTIFRKVCDAMAFAHAKGILHRDLKPENIMVGEYGEVLVMDWGLAKILGERDAAGAVKAAATDTGDYGMTMEGEVMGTPQYMSPEQAEGMVAELDTRSDIYSLGGILYAILTLRPPVGGSTLAEVLGNVKSGVLSPIGTATRMAKGIGGRPEPMTLAVPAALQAVTLKAMARDREKRYASVELFAEDIESYQNGFATSAESAGLLRRTRLWVARNRTLAASAAVLLVLLGKVVVDGQRAALAIRRLSASAPVFAARAQELLRDGDFAGALEAAENAVDLEPGNASNHVVRGNALQVLMRLEDAKKAYERAVAMGGAAGAQEGLQLTEAVLAVVAKDGEAKAKLALYEGLSASGRQMEALAFGKGLGDFWKERKKDLSAIPELVKRLEVKLLPVPGTEVLLSKTEFTVGEWKLYLKAEGLPDWQQPAKEWTQTDEHPVVVISWNEAMMFCDWLSKTTGKDWRLPTNAEWEAAVGKSKYPWGDYSPPNWDDGNYAILANGLEDPKKVGVDGIFGTAPTGSFKPNALGFYDLGGNAWEWMLDGPNDKPDSGKNLRGGGWVNSIDYCGISDNRQGNGSPTHRNLTTGFRLARGRLQSGEAGSR